ncbi:predicted protein [Uncinocarpus reesii 1704]|uniref:Glucose-methanol-choline oxidoreductase N-terminal domain-containing protein n=1 Tax=Uncinocarpus reesii (strain UAMH 1704) TaxID=336963 RepID=C4JR32_UNCRE|nr:uncharacterized protein UREG_03514 [Uncinocarpus reesii 1704]EEP78668.1 predicted protein [Uncinocarpus reesii 1704]
MLCAFNPFTYTRSFSANCYYLPVCKRPNLFLLTEATVKEIVIEYEGEKCAARGVLVRCDGEDFIVRASREVVLSAGSIQSPQLLELSGIGNPEILKAAGIEAKVCNPNVGENLQDHFMTKTVYEVQTPPDSEGSDLPPSQTVGSPVEISNIKAPAKAYLPCPVAYCPIFKMVTSQELAGLTAHIRQKIMESKDVREAKLRQSFLPGKMLGAVEFVWDGEANWNPDFKGEPGKRYGTLLQMLQYPFSRGSVHIQPMRGSKATTIDDKPTIDPRYFAGDGKIDFEVMKAGPDIR